MQAIFLKLTTLAISTIVGLVAVELLLDMHSNTSEAHKVGPLNAGTFVYNSSEFQQKQTNDLYGFRRAGFDFDKAGERENILLVGDSFVEGTGLTDEQTFAWLLNEKFNQDDIQFYNAGVGATGLNHYYNRYKDISEKLGVEFSSVFFFIFLGNDILDYEYFDIKSQRTVKKTPTDSVENSIYPVKNFIRKLFPNVYGLLKVARRSGEKNRYAMLNPLEAFNKWADENKEYYGRKHGLNKTELDVLNVRYRNIDKKIREDLETGRANIWRFTYVLPNDYQDYVYNMDSVADWRQFESSMTILNNILQFNKIQSLTVFLIPEKFQVSAKERERARLIMGNYPEDEFEDLFAINKNIVSFLSNIGPKNVDFVDVTTTLVATQKAYEYFYDVDGHFNSKGAALVAEVVENYVSTERH